jgi:hypothetical protein
MSSVGPSILDARNPVAAEPAPAAPVSNRLPLTVEHSGQTEWCWAAVSASVALFYTPASTWTQCAIVNKELGQTACCTEGAASTCNQPHVLEAALSLVQHLLRDFAGPLAFADIVQEIDAGRPVGVCIDWTGGGGHFVTVAGYDRNGEMIQVKDPLFGNSQVPLATFPAGYQGGGTWSWTYLTSP